jgi:hypothetical protein
MSSLHEDQRCLHIASTRSTTWPAGTLLMLMFVTYPLGRLRYAADVAWLATAPFLAVLVVRPSLDRGEAGRRHPSELRAV